MPTGARRRRGPGFFTSVDEVSAALAEAGYLASAAVATTVFLADQLGKPLLVEACCLRKDEARSPLNEPTTGGP